MRSATPDAYGPVRRHLRLADRLLELAVGHIRRDVVAWLRDQGARRVLDLAAGTAPLSRRLADAGLSPVALDLSPAMLALAAERGRRAPPFPVIQGDAGRLPLRPVFDAAAISLALHEMPPEPREAAWRELQRVVRPGGWIVVVDFTIPPDPGPLSRRAGAIIGLLERQVGRMHPPHYEGYLDFMRRGGLCGWLSAHDAPPIAERRYFWGNLAMVAVPAGDRRDPGTAPSPDSPPASQACSRAPLPTAPPITSPAANPQES
ncbi:MAG: methyltransferase domain-containing protein [Armatimonadetes bacterium]|nr:methyltransferase domain-containing protein [Armatimonadota bacterium]